MKRFCLLDLVRQFFNILCHTRTLPSEIGCDPSRKFQ
jgi:hypothetical protein